MKALRFERFGGPEVLDLVEVARPTMKEGELLVRVRAAGVNPSDVKNVAGRMGRTVLPRVPGRDFAGIVEEGPADWVGKEVFGTGNWGLVRDGSHAEYIVVGQDDVVERPIGLEMKAAAGMGVPFVTAGLMVEAAQVKADEDVLVVATGSVGSVAAQIAKWRGARVIAADRHETNPDLIARKLVDATINTSEEKDQRTAVLARTGGKGADVVLDTVGGVMFEPAVNSIATGGRVVEISATGTKRVSFDVTEFYHRQGKIIGVDSLAHDGRSCAAILRGMMKGLESGALKPPTGGTEYPLERAVDAYREVDAGAKGKVILVIK